MAFQTLSLLLMAGLMMVVLMLMFQMLSLLQLAGLMDDGGVDVSDVVTATD